MAAPARVSAQQITNALLLYRGNLQAVAEALHMSRNGLYARVRRLGLNLAGFRQVSTMRTVSTMPTCANQRDLAHAQKNNAAIFPSRRVVPTLISVETAESAIAIAAVPARVRPPRIQPENQERLSEAKRRLAPYLERGTETDETLLLNQFIEEQLDAWVAAKEARAKKPTRRDRARAKGEDEKP